MFDEISIFLSADNNYARQCAVTMLSVLSNTTAPQKIHFYLLTPDLSDDSSSQLVKLCSLFEARISILPIDLTVFSSFALHYEHMSLNAYSRFLGPDLCPERDRLLYLDCDLIVLGDVSTLFAYSMSGNGLSASVQVSFPYQEKFIKVFPVSGTDECFNSGVILIDADLWRKEKVAEALIELSETHSDKVEFADQDSLNVFFWKKYTHLPGHWNVEARLYSENLLGLRQDDEIKSRTKSPQIIHYTGPDKPWNSKKYVPLRSVYIEYSDRLTSLLGWAPTLEVKRASLRNFVAFIYSCVYFRAASFVKANFAEQI